MSDQRLDRERLDEWMDWKATKAGRFSWMLLTPARATVGIGAVMTFIAGFMPWAEGHAPGFAGIEDIFFSGLAGQGDGVVLILLSLAIGLLTVHRTPATSRVRTVRLMPAILVVLALLTWLNGLRASFLEIAAWQRRGGEGSISIGLWLAGLGIALMIVGTLVLLPEVIRWKRRKDDPVDLGRPGIRDIAEIIGGLAGILVGGWLGIVLGISMTGQAVVMGTIALGAVFGGLGGAYAGAWLARSIVDRLRGHA